MNSLRLRDAPLLGLVLLACGSSHETPQTPEHAGMSSVGTAAHSSRSAARAPRPVRDSFPGTDDDAATYGYPANGSDRRAITALVRTYYAAAAADDGAVACTLIYSTLADSVAEDYGRPPGPAALRGSTCRAVMTKLFRRVPDQPAAVLARTEVTGVRVYQGRGFALLHSSAMPHGEVAVARQGDRWRLQWLIGREVGPGHP